MGGFHRRKAARTRGIHRFGTDTGRGQPRHRKCRKSASIFLALALLLKPQIGVLFWLVCCLRRRWHVAVVSLSISILLLGFSAGWLQTNAPGWLVAWRQTVATLVAPGHENDPTATNHLRHDMLNIQRVLYTVFENALLVNVLAFGLVLILITNLLWHHRHAEQLPSFLLTAGAAVVLGLLPVYHRFYDASGLLVVLAWALAAWHGRLFWLARCVFICCLPFLVPGAAWLAWLARNGYFPERLIRQGWWETLVMSHQVWALLVIAALLSYALHVSEKEKNSRDEPARG